MACTLRFILAQAPWSTQLQTLEQFHAAFINFSVALLFVAGLVEIWRLVRGKAGPSPTAVICLAFGALWAGLAAAGGVQADGSSIGGGALAWHTWLGIAAAGVAVVSLLVLGIDRWRGNGRIALYRAGTLACAILVALTGYFGGTFTHGDGGLPETITNRPDQPAPANASNVKTVAAISSRLPASHFATLPLPTVFPADRKIDFQRDVQPILAHACYECHGPTKRRGALRLDNKQMTFDGGKSGPSIVAGKSAESYLIHRVLGEGNEKRMPAGRPPLPDYQIKILQAWIDQGAAWPDHASNDGGEEEKHWAYVPPVHHALPAVKADTWPRNGIDHFVLARLETEKLAPSSEADRSTLIRRLSLDLVGLPPTPAEVDAFVADDSLDAYDTLVNRLLASPHYGEKWGRHWLDVARYADTNGYEKDNERQIWGYRDWVIEAVNRDVTYDQFVIQQIAGDMLPNASVEDRIATGFHRNTMFNEEGGIDVEEFRYKAVVDRVQTTGTAFLGLTMHCAQCHDHKYDAISHQEYFQFFSMLNNADEPTLSIPRPAIAAQRKTIEAQIVKAEAALESAFPTHDEGIEWTVLSPQTVSAEAKDVVLTKQPDGAVVASGAVPVSDTYTIEAEADLTHAVALRLETLTDPSLPSTGPGRSPHGNFVVTELTLARSAGAGSAAGAGAKPEPIALNSATADFSQEQFDVSAAIDGNPATGWAIATKEGKGCKKRKLNQNRTATFRFAPTQAGPATLTATIQQAFAGHPLGKFRLSIGRVQPAPSGTMPEGERRKRFLAEKLAEWETSIAENAVQWTQLDPATYERKHGATITKLLDRSLLFTGGNLYRDEYLLGFDTDLDNVTAIRLEVLPDERLPRGGPGRSPTGGWLLSELTVTASSKESPGDPAPIEIAQATADIAGDSVARAIDDKKDTHWTVPAGDARPHAAVFQLKSPMTHAGGTRLNVALLQNYHQSENLGRLRISVTTDPSASIEAAGVPADVESILLTPPAERTPAQAARVKQHFLSITPLLAAQQQAIAQLRASMPQYPTTLAMTERATPRVTRVMHRGEFLQPKEQVSAGVPAVLHGLPKGPPDRMALARWLVAPENPLIGRVTMNRVWATYFGRGIVNTVEDFGIMGEKPSHPELLDWLATEFVRQNWSMKGMHRLIVTSATYRQSSRVAPNLLEKDPANVLLARGPRVRVGAETIRDIALAASGLLSEKIGGPSVYPPQPAGVSELSYGAMAWPTSEGPDRYRRGLYTYLKRTSPYPGLTVFDGSTSEVTCTVRNRSNTPLQALTTLNDEVFVEAAQALGRRVLQEVSTDSPEARIRQLFRLCVARTPEPSEMVKIKDFYEAQLKRFRANQADPAAVALRDPKDVPSGMDLPELAAWTMVARTVMNLDETVTKE